MGNIGNRFAFVKLKTCTSALGWYCTFCFFDLQFDPYDMHNAHVHVTENDLVLSTPKPNLPVTSSRCMC